MIRKNNPNKKRVLRGKNLLKKRKKATEETTHSQRYLEYQNWKDWGNSVDNGSWNG